MKRQADRPCNGRWLTIVFLLGSNILFSVDYPGLAAAQQKTTVMQIHVQQGATGRATLELENHCSEPHKFRVEKKAKHIRFDRPADSILVRPNSKEEIGLVLDAAGLEPKEYRDKLHVSCRDCKKGRGCRIEDHEVPVVMIVTRPSSEAGKGRVEASRFTALFAEFIEILAQLKQETGAGDSERARLLDGIALSVNQLKEKSEASSAPSPAAYLTSLQMNLDALKGLRKSASGSEKRVSLIRDAELARAASDSFMVKRFINQNPPKRARSNQTTGPSSKGKPAKPYKALEVVKQDLNIKAEYSAKTTGGWAELVQVSVVTKRQNKVVNGYEVWSVPLLWEDTPEKRERFSTTSSPSEKALPPGSYKIGIRDDNGVQQRIGGDGSPHQQVDLTVN